MQLDAAAPRHLCLLRRAADARLLPDELGFTLVKKTVNFDDPHSYHLYFGDDAGSPGTLLTFFEWPRAEAGRLGRGTLDSIGIGTPVGRRRRRRSRIRTACACGCMPARAPRARRRGGDRQPRPLRRPVRRRRAAALRRAGRGAGADRRRHDAPHRLAGAGRRRAAGVAGAPDRARAAADRRCRTASTSTPSTSACRTGC